MNIHIIKKTILILLSALFLTFSYFMIGAYCQSNDGYNILKRTKITPVLETEIIKENNLIYCMTFQLAWNKLCNDIVKAPIVLYQPPNYINHLNKNLTNEIFITSNEYIVQAGFIKDGIIKTINKDLKTKFGNNAPQIDSEYDQSAIIAYAYLLITFEFRYVFENILEPLKFMSSDNKLSNIASFGFNKLNSKDPQKIELRKHILNQVSACYFDEKQGFILKIYANNGNVITISTLPPCETLKKTFQQIKSFSQNNSTNRKFVLGDTLKMPKIDFKLSHSFNELLNTPIKNTSIKDYFFTKAIQDIKFSLDEKGIKLKSSSKAAIEKGIGDIILPKDFIINGPFVLYLTKYIQDEFDLGEPYFMMYVDNDELLVKK